MYRRIKLSQSMKFFEKDSEISPLSLTKFCLIEAVPLHPRNLIQNCILSKANPENLHYARSLNGVDNSI